MRVSFNTPIERQEQGMSPETIAKLALVKEAVTFKMAFGFYGYDWKGDHEHQLSCPIHGRLVDSQGRRREGSPSMHYYAEDGKVWCFACNDGGDVVWFVQKFEKTDFRSALNKLMDVFHLKTDAEGIARVMAMKTEREAAEKKKRGDKDFREAALVRVADQINDLIWDLKLIDRGCVDAFDRLLESIWPALEKLENEPRYSDYSQGMNRWRDFALDRIRATWQAIHVNE